MQCFNKLNKISVIDKKIPELKQERQDFVKSLACEVTGDYCTPRKGNKRQKSRPQDNNPVTLTPDAKRINLQKTPTKKHGRVAKAALLFEDCSHKEIGIQVGNSYLSDEKHRVKVMDL